MISDSPKVREQLTSEIDLFLCKFVFHNFFFDSMLTFTSSTKLFSIKLQFFSSCLRSLDFFPQTPWRTKKKLFKSIFIIFLRHPLNLIRIFEGYFSSASRYCPSETARTRESQGEKKLSFIYDNKQNSKRLEYKWMSVKCFDQPRPNEMSGTKKSDSAQLAETKIVFEFISRRSPIKIKLWIKNQICFYLLFRWWFVLEHFCVWPTPFGPKN